MASEPSSGTSAGAGDGAASASVPKPNDAAKWEAFRTQGKEMVDFIADFYQGIEALPVKSQVEPGYLAKALPKTAPEHGEDFGDIMADVQKHIVPGVTHWQHPSFFSYFPANTSGPSLLGDMLSGTFGCISFSWVASPAATELETIVMDWLGQMVALPEAFLSKGTGGGVIQGTASEATLVALLAARAKALKTLNADGQDARAFKDRLVAYHSDQAHSSVAKAGMIAGLDASQFRKLPSAEDCTFDPDTLATAIAEDKAKGLVPFFVVATSGTTSSGAFDPLSAIGDVAAENGMWVHVDAAWAGSAAVCPEHRGFLEGLDKCHSFDFNPHKWLMTTFDCSAMWVTERSYLLDALSITPEYLRSREYESGLVHDYRDWQIPLGRRFRSLKLWMVLRQFGVKALQERIRDSIALADRFESLVRGDDRFEVTHKSLALVCFRINASDEVNAAALEAVNETGKTFMVNSQLGGKFVWRFAVGTPSTEARHVDAAWAVIKEHATKALADADIGDS